MSVTAPSSRLASLSRSLTEAGAVLVPVDAGVAHPFEHNASDMMHALCTSPFARGVIARAVARLAVGSESVVEPLAGMLVIPVHLPRLLVGGRFVAVTLLAEALEGETVEVLASRGRIDALLAKKLLSILPPWDRRSSGRFRNIVAALARAECDRLAALDAGAQLSTAWEELHLLHSLSSQMAVGASPRDFALRTLAEVRQTLGCCWTALRVDASAAALFEVEVGTVLVSGNDNGVAEKLLTDAGVVDRAAVLGADLVVAPSRRENEAFGLLAAGERTSGDGAMSSCERSLVETAAGNLAVFLDNARLYRDLDRMFIGALSALVSAIDAKDPYTRGHSQRVALLSRSIAIAAGLSASEVKNIYISGLVHDVGKIGVPEQVLRKVGKLTETEYEQVKQHPEIGWRILRDIPQFAEILDGVRFHHERFDGAGYPLGLAGADIPIAARIIGIADTFDAMSSNRTYRAARGRREVLAEMSRLGGTQFDSLYLTHFLSLDLSAYDAINLWRNESTSDTGDASKLDAHDQDCDQPLSLESLCRRNSRRAA